MVIDWKNFMKGNTWRGFIFVLPKVAAMDIINIAHFPKFERSASSPCILFDRQLSPHRQSRCRESCNPGFSPNLIRSMKIANKVSLRHSGCVNTANFNKNGTLLVTGSDDLTVKIWGSPNFSNPDNVKRLISVPTGHTSNIFHALVGSLFLSVLVEVN